MINTGRLILRIVIAVAVIIGIASVIDILVNGSITKPKVSIEIDPAQVSYVKAYYGSEGSETIRMEDYPEEVTDLIEMLNGKYTYFDNWKLPDSSSSPYVIEVYDTNDSLMERIRFKGSLVYVVHRTGKSYYRYKNSENTLDFSSFYMLAFGVEL